MNNQTINQQELLTILLNINSSTFVNILSEVEVRMNKKNNPYYQRVFKRTKGNYLIGNTYENRVITNEVKEGLEGDFTSDENKVGDHVSKVVLYNEKLNRYYLQYEYFKETKVQTTYLFEGNEIDKVLFESYLVKRSETSRQEQERKVFFQSFKLDSIKEITINGTHYIIE